MKVDSEYILYLSEEKKPSGAKIISLDYQTSLFSHSTAHSSNSFDDVGIDQVVRDRDAWDQYKVPSESILEEDRTRRIKVYWQPAPGC